MADAGGEGEPEIWPTTADAYEVQEEVGQGAFATVYRARCLERDGEEVALKIIALEQLNTSIEDLQGEVRTMRSCRHPNVLSLHASFVHRDQLWLVMPLMDKGSCYYAIRDMRAANVIQEGQGLREEWIRAILKRVLQGVEYLHAQKHIHRDIKAGNILLSSRGEIRLGDFGVAGWMAAGVSREDSRRRTFVGTPCWMAPEVMDQERGYDEKADIWSVGITALELARGYAPYAKLAPMQVLMRTLQQPSPSLQTYGPAPPGTPAFSKHFNKFVEKCLQKDPAKRVGASTLLKESYISGADTSVITSEFLPNVRPVGADKMTQLSSKPCGYTSAELPMPVSGTTWVFPAEDEDADAADGTKEADLEELEGALGEERENSAQEQDGDGAGGEDAVLARRAQP